VTGGRFGLAHRVSAVSGDFMAVRRSAWEQVGGFDADHLPAAFGDVDLCLRLAAAGWRTVWTPRAAAVHRGGAHLPGHSGAEERQRSAAAGYMQRRWADELRRDPAMNPNLRATGNCVELTLPSQWRI
jgi:O-antigen biosynthesis protein